ncbi:hypothetical protein SCHPADRAFT_889543 [Schizopora paradoxa]|uniref:Uncharacterized protein n=1 Tax=Schizopora paradoxa TaxID=27342 RepID=A0A0H2RR44_9AGAM|nr:hypothetical protein SCHPADRAFT_889543 [Schizopora paradoxa]
MSALSLQLSVRPFRCLRGQGQDENRTADIDSDIKSGEPYHDPSVAPSRFACQASASIPSSPRTPGSMHVRDDFDLRQRKSLSDNSLTVFKEVLVVASPVQNLLKPLAEICVDADYHYHIAAIISKSNHAYRDIHQRLNFAVYYFGRIGILVTFSDCVYVPQVASTNACGWVKGLTTTGRGLGSRTDN